MKLFKVSKKLFLRVRRSQSIGNMYLFLASMLRKEIITEKISNYLNNNGRCKSYLYCKAYKCFKAIVPFKALFPSKLAKSKSISTNFVFYINS